MADGHATPLQVDVRILHGADSRPADVEPIGDDDAVGQRGDERALADVEPADPAQPRRQPLEPDAAPGEQPATADRAMRRQVDERRATGDVQKVDRQPVGQPLEGGTAPQNQRADGEIGGQGPQRVAAAEVEPIVHRHRRHLFDEEILGRQFEAGQPFGERAQVAALIESKLHAAQPGRKSPYRRASQVQVAGDGHAIGRRPGEDRLSGRVRGPVSRRHGRSWQACTPAASTPGRPRGEA